MTNLKFYGRIFFGLGIVGIGILHFFYPGIRPIIIPELTNIPAPLNFVGYFIGALLIFTGVIISIGKKHNTLSLLMGLAFLILGVFIHLTYFLFSTGPFWINLNKVLALSGGFLLISQINAPNPEHKVFSSLSKIAPIGMYLYAIMLYNFGLGHIMNVSAISEIVPKYIPFPKFWTFIGGIALMGAAISIFSKIMIEKIAFLLAIILFIWLFSLHVYYAIRFPNWQEGENFMGVFTCLAFCGIALIISQSNSGNKSTH